MAWRASLRAAAGAPLGDAGVAAPSGASRRPLRDGSRHDPSAPAREALELMSCVYNLPSEWTSRAPVVFLALLVEAPPDPTLPYYKRPRVITPEYERHHLWRVAGVTEPLRVARDARSTRFSVPVHLDRLAGPLDKVHRDALAKRRVALALYRIPDHDDADDVYVAADENLPPERRPLPPTSRLDDFAYLGEAKIRLDELLVRVRAGGGRSGERGSRHRYALAPARARADTRPIHPDDAPAASNAAVEVLAAVPARWPRPTPREAGRYVGDFAVHFSPPRIHLEPVAPRAVHARLCRWAGDGFQPVYSTLIAASDVDTEIRTVARATDATPGACASEGFVARIPTMHVPVAALRGGGATEEDEGPDGTGGGTGGGGGSLNPNPKGAGVSGGKDGVTGLLPREDVSWRLEFIARLRDDRDALLGWLDVTPRTLELAGREATRETPAVFQCECARGVGDFDVARLDPAAGDAPPVAMLERWVLRPGRDTGRLRSPATKVPARVREAARRAAAEEGEEEAVEDGNEGRSSRDVRAKVDVKAEIGGTFGVGWKNIATDPKTTRAKSSPDAKTSRDAAARAPPADADSPEWGVPDDDSSSGDSSSSDSDATGAETPPRSAEPRTAEQPKLKTKPPPTTTKAAPRSSPPARADPPRWNSSARVGAARSDPARFRRGGARGANPTDSESDGGDALAMTPTRALLERKFREEGKTTLDREDAPAVIRARGAVFPGEAEAEAAGTATGTGDGGGTVVAVDEGSSSGDVRPRPPTPPCAAELHFAPDPGLIAAADAAVREAVEERLRARSKPELVDSALRVRRELLTKLNGELRYLEQRARREARTAGEKNDKGKSEGVVGRGRGG